MLSLWVKFCRLSRRDKVLHCRAAGYLVAYVLALRLLGLRRALALSRYPAASTQSGGRDAGSGYAKRAGLALDRARGRLGVGTCLSHSLALRRMLGSVGIPAVVRIGTRRQGGRLTAHAWVETEPGTLAVAPQGPAYQQFPVTF